MKTATQHPDFTGLVILPDGSCETKVAAIEQGYAVGATAAKAHRLSVVPGIAATPMSIDAHSLYRSSIMSLPEASGRRAAAERLAADNTSTTLSPADAASLLRGLPTETNTTKDTSMTTTLSTEGTQRFRRLADIRVAALNLNAARGNDKARVEARRLANAMALYDSGLVPLADALNNSGLEARDTIEKILNVR